MSKHEEDWTAMRPEPRKTDAQRILELERRVSELEAWIKKHMKLHSKGYGIIR